MMQARQEAYGTTMKESCAKSVSCADVHWEYFLLLEKDFADILDCIESCKENLKVFGPKLAKLLLAVGSEVSLTSL